MTSRGIEPGQDEGDATLPPGRFDAAGIRPGALVDHYVLRHELGRGGMGQVFLAEDTKLHRQVAIKFVMVPSPTAADRFIAEARVTARCTHPNIVVIHEISEHRGVPYTVLEYVTGESLTATLRRGPMAPAQVIAIMTQVARAIAAAHARGIVHRDLKPGNILLSGDGTVKVVDFGIAKLVGAPSRAEAGLSGAATDDEHTAASQMVGTLHYMAPEQARREPLDGRADLWAFGITTYKLLSGRRPFDGLSGDALFDRLIDLDAPVARVDTVAPATPPALVELVARCLEKHVDRRIGSAAEVVAALEAMRELAAAAPADSTARPPEVDRDPRTGEPSTGASPRTIRSRPRRRSVAAVALVAVVVAVAAPVIWIGAHRADDGAARARPPSPASIARVSALFAECDRLEQHGQREASARLYVAFLDEERDPKVVALARIGHADRLRDRGEPDAALDDYARAYAGAADPSIQRRALLELGAIHSDQRAWDRLAAVLDVYDRQPGPRDARGEDLRERMQLGTRTRRDYRADSPATAAIAGALLTGRRAAADARTALVVDGVAVGVEGDELVVMNPADGSVRSRQPAQGLTNLRCAGRGDGGAWVVGITQDGPHPRWALVRIGSDQPALDVESVAGPIRACGHAGDLDGDGRDEVYLFGARTLVRLVPGAGGTWHRHELALGSEVGDMIVGDLDGDGRAELVVAVGEWRAYDVRVLRAGPDGELHVDARIRLGVVTALAPLGRDARGRALVAALKEDAYPSIRNLPADRPAGVPAGVYVLTLDAAGLEVVRRIPIVLARGSAPMMGGMYAADLDGDGRPDLVTAVCERQYTRCDLLALRGRADGGFDTRVIGGLRPLGVLDVDGDGDHEVLTRVDGGDAPWLLGAGGEPVPPLAAPPVHGEPPSPAARADAAVAATWQRAEELARIGHVEAAVDTLTRIAAVGPTLPIKRDALRRAAALLRARELPAAETYRALAALEPPGSRAQLDAYLAALDEHDRRLEIGDALRLADLALGHPASTPDERARLTAQRAQLAIAPVALFDGHLLAAPWRVDAPALVHVVPGTGRLTVETLVPGPVAAVPLTRTGELITVTLDAEIARTEWSAGLRIRIGPRDRSLPGELFVEISGRGGGGVYQRQHMCGGANPPWLRATPMPDADAAEPVHVELALRPAHGTARCAVTLGDRADVAAVALPPSVTTDWELSLEGGYEASLTSAVARFTSIEVAGATPSLAADDTAGAAARALANHQPAAARAALARLSRADAATWRARRLAVIIADELGDRTRATALLTDALTAPPGQRPTDVDLAQLVRARDGLLAPIVRAALGDRVAPVLSLAWFAVAVHDLDQPRVRDATIRDLDPLPPPSRATADATLVLAGILGEARLAAGRPDAGRRTLIDALALLTPGADPTIRDRAEAAAYLLAEDAAIRGDRAAAIAWGLRALAVSNYPELAADRLLLGSATGALADDPAWARVTQLGRRLAAAPP